MATIRCETGAPERTHSRVRGEVGECIDSQNTRHRRSSTYTFCFLRASSASASFATCATNDLSASPPPSIETPDTMRGNNSVSKRRHVQCPLPTLHTPGAEGTAWPPSTTSPLASEVSADRNAGTTSECPRSCAVKAVAGFTSNSDSGKCRYVSFSFVWMRTFLLRSSIRIHRSTHTHTYNQRKNDSIAQTGKRSSQHLGA